jgi:uncharacterized repeat protein (TIGR03803 family)
VISDPSGNLYGSIFSFGTQSFKSAIFGLTSSGSDWRENTLYEFTGDQSTDLATGVVLDQQGNLFGATTNGGQNGSGSVFELSPQPGGGWSFNTIYSFQPGDGGPEGKLSIDNAGNLYGTAYFNGAHGQGSVFKLANTVQGWVYSDLHDFDGTDGSLPTSSVLLGGNGKLYGTASGGGTSGCGVVWEIAP